MKAVIEKPSPKFSCRCAQDCEQRVPYFAWAPMAECFPDGACECTCHEFVEPFRQHRAEMQERGWLYSGRSR